MYSFSPPIKTLAFVSVCLLVATAAALSQRTRPPEPRRREEEVVECVAFRNATAAGFVDISVSVHRESAGSFCARTGGRDQASCGFDDDEVWFWLRSYDAGHYYFCAPEEADDVGLSPMLRPLFIRCASGAEFVWGEYPHEGIVTLSDGSYSVEISLSQGRPKSMRYSLDGTPSLALDFLEHQACAGHDFPKTLRLTIEGVSPVEIKMGEVEVNPPEWPVARPPQRSSGVRLQP